MAVPDLPMKYLTRAINVVRDQVDSVPAEDRKTAAGMSAHPQHFDGGVVLDRHVRAALQLVGQAIESGEVKSPQEYLAQVGRDLRALDTDKSGALSETEIGDHSEWHPLLPIALRLHSIDRTTEPESRLDQALSLARLKLSTKKRGARVVMCQLAGEDDGGLRVFDTDPQEAFRLLGGRGKLQEGPNGRLRGEILEGKAVAEFVTGPLR